MTRADVSFPAMGSTIRLIVEPAPGLPDPQDAAEDVRSFLERFEQTLSRFRPDSELCALNADRRDAVPASPLLRDAVRAGVWAAERSGGLVDPTLLDELERAGYRESLRDAVPARLVEALLFAPARRPAEPHPTAAWRSLEVDETFGVIRRPPGLRFDTGGTGKGLAADLIAERLGGYSRVLVDCGGDMRVAGHATAEAPFEVLIEHPLTGECARAITVSDGAVATSGLDVRIWRGPDGRFAHHLLDPSTGLPAWTGLIGVTALGRSALEAETVSKAALLSGPDGARELLGELGGLIVHDDSEVEVVGPARVRPRLTINVPASALVSREAA